jgi:hypothetical protein
VNRWRRAAVVALACQLPAATGVPLSRWTGPELAAELIAQGLASAPISVSSLLRILAENPIKPWQYQSWLYPRDPDFAAKARVILDLYQGEPLGPGDRILSTPSRPSRPAAHPRDPARRARPACPCGARVRPPRRARTARRPRRAYRESVCLHPGHYRHHRQGAPERGHDPHPGARVLAQQVEIFFSIVQKKVVSPNDFASLDQLSSTLLAFIDRYNQTARPFNWKFTATDLTVCSTASANMSKPPPRTRWTSRPPPDSDELTVAPTTCVLTRATHRAW